MFSNLFEEVLRYIQQENIGVVLVYLYVLNNNVRPQSNDKVK